MPDLDALREALDDFDRTLEVWADPWPIDPYGPIIEAARSVLESEVPGAARDRMKERGEL